MPIPDEIPVGSQEYLSIQFSSDTNLQTSAVQLGLSPTTDPPVTWLDGVWEGDNIARTANVIDANNFAPGVYEVWARVLDVPEVLVRPYGLVRFV